MAHFLTIIGVAVIICWSVAIFCAKAQSHFKSTHASVEIRDANESDVLKRRKSQKFFWGQKIVFSSKINVWREIALVARVCCQQTIAKKSVQKWDAQVRANEWGRKRE